MRALAIITDYDLGCVPDTDTCIISLLVSDEGLHSDILCPRNLNPGNGAPRQGNRETLSQSYLCMVPRMVGTIHSAGDV